MTRIERALPHASRAIAAMALLSGCAKPEKPAASASGVTDAPRGTLTTPAHRPVNASSSDAFAASVLAKFREMDQQGGWKPLAPLVLTNDKKFVVDLERILNVCRQRPAECDAEVDNYVTAALRIARQPRDRVVNESQLVPVLRDASYLDSVPPHVRAAALTDPFPGDMAVFYMIDEGGSVRGATVEDLPKLGLERGQVAAVARKNLLARLGEVSDQQPCPAEPVLWQTENYFESSRLLLTQPWASIAARANGRLVVGVPGSDTLLVACNPGPSDLQMMFRAAEGLSREAKRPVSSTLLEWTPEGWRAVRR